MPRLPGHVAVGSSDETASAQSSPFRLTTAAHENRPPFRPPASPPVVGAAFTSCRSLSASGTSLQVPAGCCALVCWSGGGVVVPDDVPEDDLWLQAASASGRAIRTAGSTSGRRRRGIR